MYNNLAIIHTMSDDTTGSPQPTSLKSALKRPTTSEELQEPEGSPPRSRRDAADAKEIQAVLDKPIYETPYDMATSCTQNRNRCFMSRNKPTDPEYINEWKLCHTSPGEDAEDGCRYSTHLERVIPDCVKADTSRCPRPSAGASRDSQYLDWQEWYDGDSEFGDWWKGVKFSQGTKRTVDQRPYDQYSKEHRGKEALDPLGVTPEERAARADPYYRGEEVFPSGFTPQDKEAARQAMQADAAEAAAAASSSSVGGRRTKRRKSKRKPSKKRHGRKTRGRKTRGRKTLGRKTLGRKTKKHRNVRHKRKTIRHKKRGGGGEERKRSKSLRRRMEREVTPPKPPHEHDPLQERGYPPHDWRGGPDVGMQNLVEALRTSLDNPTRDEMRSTYRDAYKTFHHLPEEMKENFIIRAVNDRREDGGRLPEEDDVLYGVLKEVADYREKIREETSKYGHKISPRYDWETGRSKDAATWGVPHDPPCCTPCERSWCGSVFCGKKECHPCKLDPYYRTLVADLDSDQMECEVSPRGGGRRMRPSKTKKRRNVRHKRKTRARRKQTHES